MTIPDPDLSNTNYLTIDTWRRVNQMLVKKAISEFSHELVFKPELIKKSEKYNTYVLISDVPGISNKFNAVGRALDHWDIDEKTIVKWHNDKPDTIDALLFITEFKETLGIPPHFLPTYMEEISSTLTSAAYKYNYQQYSSRELVNSSFQAIEHAMTEGHPCFVANNGRIGFTGEDYIKYAPETNQPFKLLWLAGH